MCTHIHISSIKNNFYWGRTLDTSFNLFDVDSKVTIVPNVPKNFTLETQSKPRKTKYTILYINLL